MGADAYTVLTCPTWALDVPAIRDALAAEAPERVTAEPDGTTTVAGTTVDGTFAALEAALAAAAIAFDRWTEDPGTGAWDTCVRRIFRPPGPAGPGCDVTIPVTRANVPCLRLDQWDALAAVPQGPITWADVQHALGLDQPAVADWARAHCPASRERS
ncbi:MAG: hypothetical protein K6V97_11300 [Actinomycetia bacterium]|nr:hypothetical protein [Actinomycetes bacterium]